MNQPLQCLFEPCFVGGRGSQNYEINANSAFGPLDTLAIARYVGTRTAASDLNNGGTTSTDPDYKMRTAFLDRRYLAQTGCALTNMRTQTGLQVQAPMYSRFRFLGNKPDERNLGKAEDGSDVDNLVIMTCLKTTAGQNPIDLALDLYTSIGTDYQLLHFVNVPSFWIYGGIPGAI